MKKKVEGHTFPLPQDTVKQAGPHWDLISPICLPSGNHMTSKQGLSLSKIDLEDVEVNEQEDPAAGFDEMIHNFSLLLLCTFIKRSLYFASLN